MLPNRWIALRQDNWARLASLLDRVGHGGLRDLPAHELRELGVLYRQVAADLSAVRAEAGAHATLAAYLNQLLHRAHILVYRGSAGRVSARGTLRFLLVDYPRLFRRMLPYFAAALALFAAAAVLGALCTQVRPAFARASLGPRMMDTIEHHKMWTESILSAKPQASSAILTNNISVCFLTFASGITFGLGTLFLLWNNGWQMGVIGAACAQHGLGLSLWSFVASHGALELPSIFIAGAAGLRLATGLLFPGYLARGPALTQAGAEAVRLVAGTVPLLVVAGMLEGFLSPTHAPAALKFSVCAALLSLLVCWLALGGRGISGAGDAKDGRAAA